jgi:hypothetical protein
MELARVVGLWRYPVKSMQGEAVEGGRLGPAGLTGDRRWALRDAGGDRLLTGKRSARILEAAARLVDGAAVITLPDGTELSSRDPGVSEALSAWLGEEVRLEDAGPNGSFQDGAAAHLLTGSSLRAIAALERGERWEARRFRPTALLEADEEGFVEDGWAGRGLLLGGAHVHVTEPTVRCAMPTRAQPGGIAEALGVLTALKRRRRSLLGVYAAVLSPGRVALDDPLQPLG